MNEDEWRLEVELEDERGGFGLLDRLRSHDLDDETRKRLGGRAMVTRDGPRLFVYASTDDAAREAERVVRELAAEDGLTARTSLTRWHPVEEAWKDAALPLPRTEAQVAEELDQKEEAEWQEAADEGSFDWLVKVALPTRAAAAELEEALRVEGLPVHRRWRYLTIDAVTEEQANELADRVRAEAPPEAEVWVEATAGDIPSPSFVLLESRLPGL
ncbi:MAG TPA: hypothetical protein VFL41_13280 [Gaiellaceae bacterium]|nr:hypothetical protein [Gaiellaceae bacterium]